MRPGVANDDDLAQIAQPITRDLFQLWQVRGADNRDAGAAVVEHLFVVGGPGPSVYRDRDRADLDSAEEAIEKFGRIIEQQEDTLFKPDVQFAEGITGSVGSFEQLPIAYFFVSAFDGDSLAASLLDIAVDEIGGDVESVRKSDQERCDLPLFEARRSANCRQRGRSIARKKKAEFRGRIVKEDRISITAKAEDGGPNRGLVR